MSLLLRSRMKFPTQTLERKLFHDGYSSVIGVDEVGMGCLAGPVVVCAVAVSPGTPNIAGIRDSKLLSPQQRETLAHTLKQSGIRFQISLCYPKVIDRINIYQAARKAMRRAVDKLGGDIVLVDGPHAIAGLNLPQRAIVKGDQKVFAIACASILAKVHRDRMMMRYAKRFPEYGFERHKGYGTHDHFKLIRKYGFSPIHRRSFLKEL